MTTLPEITGLSRGARFFRADLHIRSAASSLDVKDPAATPEAIVTTAAQEGLKIIAITDHNEIHGVAAALGAAAAADIFVVPAVELSTSEGHLLCYVPKHESLQRFHGQLTMVDRGTPTSRCQNSILDCLEKLIVLDGFAVLAHVDNQGGFETEVPGASPHKADVLCHRALLGLELKNAKSSISYSDEDPDAGRVRMGQERVRRLGLGTHQRLARVLNSVEGERQVRQVISTAAQAIARGTSQQDRKTDIATLKTAADPKLLVVGGAEFSALA